MRQFLGLSLIRLLDLLLLRFVPLWGLLFIGFIKLWDLSLIKFVSLLGLSNYELWGLSHYEVCRIMRFVANSGVGSLIECFAVSLIR